MHGGDIAIISPSKLVSRHRYVLLAIALSVFVWAPLTYPGYFQAHSGFVPFFNLLHLSGIPLSLGWMPSIATHYDPLRSDGYLAYYLARLLLASGMTVISGIKVVFALSWVLGTLGMYWWLRRPLGAAGACLAALVYSYLPYRIAAVYVRGAWGEALCLGLIPLGFATALGMHSHKLPRRSLVLSSLAWLLIGLSQLGLGLWAFLCLLSWWALSGDWRIRFRPVLAAGGGCVGATIFSLWTAGWHTRTGGEDFFNHFLYPAQLVSPYWGFGASRPGWNDGLSLGLGLAPVALAFVTLFLLLKQARTKHKHSSPAEIEHADSLHSERVSWKAPLLTAAGLILLTLPVSAPFWRLSSLFQLLTYPWQLIGLAGMCLSVAAGGVLHLRSRLCMPSIQAVLIGFVLLASYSYLQPRYSQYVPAGEPQASWGGYQILLLEAYVEVEIPSTAAGLPVSTSGRLPLDEYGAPRPGDILHLILTWQATKSLERDLKLFAHLLDTSEILLSQADPLLGAAANPEVPGKDYLTSQWELGRLIVTDTAIYVPGDAPSGPYHIAVGLYESETGQRWPVDDTDDDKITLDLSRQDNL